MTEQMGNEVIRHYKEITFRENRARLRLLREFLGQVHIYFENSSLNMMTGVYAENEKAMEAKAAMNLVLKKVYQVIRLANITPSAASSSSLAVKGHGSNIDLILNIFNLGRNDIPPHAAIDYIEMAIDVYRSNRMDSFVRTINPLYWIMVVVNYFSRGTAR